MKSADEVIKEIDDLIEDSDVEEEELSEHGNQVTIEREPEFKIVTLKLVYIFTYQYTGFPCYSQGLLSCGIWNQSI